jgi:hypothetical protein
MHESNNLKKKTERWNDSNSRGKIVDRGLPTYIGSKEELWEWGQKWRTPVILAIWKVEIRKIAV